jgi:aspartyl-tRNA(Asn)/glutamyl-tRNA(Gln) amidotransferase subunit A
VAVLTDYDALLTPTTPIPAVGLDEVDESSLPLSRFTRPINYYGCCALCLPMGRCRSGLPASLQVIARPFDETTALRIGWALEEEGGLTVERPPSWDP